MKFVHTMIRVLDPERSLKFYRDGLGLVLKRRSDNKEKEYSLFFLSIPGDETSADLELTYNWDRTEPYELGTGYGHIALVVDSIDDLGKQLQEHGIQWSWGPRIYPDGGGMAFLEDPDGYEIEILQRGKA